MLYGVDIHPRYQAGIDLSLLHRQGYRFLVAKATEGTSIPNHSTMSAAAFKAKLLRWMRQARELGMVPGMYHWLKRGNPVEQAKLFHSIVNEAGGPTGMLIQLDCEDNATLADVKAWAAAWRALSGNHPFMLYTGKWWWGPKGWDGTEITPYLWDSHYITDDKNTAQDDPAKQAARIPLDWWSPDYGNWPLSTVLQFTSKGDAGGLTNNVDLNAFPGTMEDLLKLTKPQPIDSKGDHDMWVKYGDKGNPNDINDQIGQSVAALQADLIDVGIDLTPVGGIDGKYGDGTAAGLVSALGAEIAGDGKAYGWRQRRALQALLWQFAGDAGLVPHSHTYDPAAGVSGPAVPA